MHSAAYGDRLFCLKELIEQGCDKNAKDNVTTPLPPFALPGPARSPKELYERHPTPPPLSATLHVYRAPSTTPLFTPGLFPFYPTIAVNPLKSNPLIESAPH